MKYLALFIFFHISLFGICQSLLDKRISINIQNKPLGNALFEIGKIANVNFTYDSRIIPINKLVSVNVTNKTLRDVLIQVINDPTIDFILIGNQLLLKRSTKITATPYPPIKKTVIAPKKDSIPKDTLPLTKVNTDTLKIDTNIVAADTIALDTPDTHLQKAKWTLGFNFSPFMFNETYTSSTKSSYMDQINQFEKNTFSYSLGISSYHSIKDFLLQTGLNYTFLNKQITYNLLNTKTSIIDNGYYTEPLIKDSIYFVLHNTDTTWFVNYDSSWINKLDTITTTSNLNKTGRSTIHYLQIPIILGYQFYINKISITPKIGLIASLITSKNGATLNTDEASLIELKDLPFSKILASFYGGLQLNMAITKKLYLNQDIYYTRNINNVYRSNYDINKKYNSIGYSLGLSYRLK